VDTSPVIAATRSGRPPRASAAGGRSSGRRPSRRFTKWRYAWFHRRKRKPDFRGLWIIRINAAARELGVSYSKLIAALDKSNIALDRKILSDLAISDPAAFKKVVETARAAA